MENTEEVYNEQERAEMIANVRQSTAQDPKRWVDSYVNHSTQAVRRRVIEELSKGNGHLH